MSPLRCLLVLLALLLPSFHSTAWAEDLILDNTSMTLGGRHTYGEVRLTNGARIVVPPFDGTDRLNTGNLELRADRIYIDATSAISARGAGYQARRCVDGTGPAGVPRAGGRGGCSVFDSGGGGGHFGGGGRGTKDCFTVAPPNSCQFPDEFEEDCGLAIDPTGTACTDNFNCRTNDALPTVAGQSYRHSIYDIEFGAAGGDKGCRDGDGFGFEPLVGGHGGGRIVLVAVNPAQSGSLIIEGDVNSEGYRGCASGNDSGGGGAGGSILLVGDQVDIGPTAVISAAGGLGGDSRLKDLNEYPECTDTQQGAGECDDCGGGGGGGIVNVQSRVSNINTGATFNVSGALGGTCPICQGEAGGGAGELQIDGAYVGEVCDGYDNDFDGVVDNDILDQSCGLGSCATTVAGCQGGVPGVCTPAVSDPSCFASLGTARPRIALLVDSSASMLLSLAGVTTFGDGSSDHPGIDVGTDGQPNDARLFIAKQAVTQLISAYPEIDFALARYHQDQGTNRSCQTSKWLECQGACCSYDNPGGGNPTSPVSCNLSLPREGGGTIDLALREDSPLSNRCINYSGTCGSPRRGADILVGFESDIRQYLMWLDGGETNFNPSAQPGNYCRGLGGDCELRGTGPTPIAESLRALYDYLTPIQTTDPALGCRGYSVVLVSDGAEECGGNPVQAATELLASGIRTYVIGVSVDANQAAALDAIASAGGTESFIPVNAAEELLPALTSIVSSSIRTELCNGVDDNCNGLVDEGFNVGAPCDNGLQGVCRTAGALACAPNDPQRTVCNLGPPGGTPQPERCNGLDDDCNGLVDEGNPEAGGTCGSSVGECRPGTQVCQGGTLECLGQRGAQPELCDGRDNDCDGDVDDDVPLGGPCGRAVGECTPGVFVCAGTAGYVCQGEGQPTTEVCDGRDNDCDGAVDDNVSDAGQACNTLSDGTPLCRPGILRCISGELRCQGGVRFRPLTCGGQPDECTLASTDGGPSNEGCPANSACIGGACRTPCAFTTEFPCSGNLLCRNGFCVPPECGGRLCTSDETCVNDRCVDKCTQIRCPQGEVCIRGGRCVANSCYLLGCPDGLRCEQNACVADPCFGKTCAADQFCRDGACVGTCEGIVCSRGQSCRDGACVADPCSGINCPTGLVCSTAGGSPSCVSDPCNNVFCDVGRTCRGGSCVDDPCNNIDCPGDPDRVVCRDGQCESRTPPPRPEQEDRVTVGGGRFFSCSVSGPATRGSGLGMSLLMLAMLGLLRRRREGR